MKKWVLISPHISEVSCGVYDWLGGQGGSLQLQGLEGKQRIGVVENLQNVSNSEDQHQGFGTVSAVLSSSLIATCMYSNHGPWETEACGGFDYK